MLKGLRVDVGALIRMQPHERPAAHALSNRSLDSQLMWHKHGTQCPATVQCMPVHVRFPS